MISQVTWTVTSNCDVINRLVQNISYSKLVQDYLNETEPSEKFLQFKQLQDYILNLAAMKDGIIDIALFSNNGTSFNVNGEIESVHRYTEEIPKKQLYYYTEMKTITINNQKRNCFIVGARIYSTVNFDNINRELGTLLILIDVNSLAGYKKEDGFQEEPGFYMLDRDNQVFFSNDSNIAAGSRELSVDFSGNANNAEFRGRKYNVQIGDIPDIGGKVVFMVPKSELLRGIADIRQQELGVFFIALILLAIPFAFVINNILQPLKKFMQFMNEIKAGKIKSLKRRITLNGYAEINIMANDFNGMLDEVDDLTHRLVETNTRLYEAELAKRQSELEYLKSQINPHFLYNTLESIKGIAADEGSKDIFTMTKSLGQIFRYSIKGADIVTLEVELNMIKSYLYIQKIRFRNRLDVSYDFPERTLQCKIPKMILQPIAENAIYHGIEPKVGTGHLRMEGGIQAGRLVICISDDGVGIERDKLEKIRAELRRGQGKREMEPGIRSSIGLINANNRIKLSYGEDFGITVESEYGNGTKVTIILPDQE
jgi:two-component system sensor histidine kinase YesM